MKNTEIVVLNKIAQTIFDKKGFNILALDLRAISSIADYTIIAEGHVDKHVQAIAGAIQSELKSFGEPLLHAEGVAEGDWIVLDYGSIMVHLFKPGLRERYMLEELWQKGEIVDLQISITPLESEDYASIRR